MKQWVIKVYLEDGLRYEYVGVFRSAFDAVTAVLDKVPGVVAVSALRRGVRA